MQKLAEIEMEEVRFAVEAMARAEKRGWTQRKEHFSDLLK